MMGIRARDKIPNEALKKIFPNKLERSLASERVYSYLKKMILSGRLKKGRRLIREKIAQNFNVSETAVSRAFSQLKKDGLVIIKWGIGSFID
jgi:DNA-binding GntR family transcriptional regulator